MSRNYKRSSKGAQKSYQVSLKMKIEAMMTCTTSKSNVHSVNFVDLNPRGEYVEEILRKI